MGWSWWVLVKSLGGYSAGNNNFSPYSAYSGLKEVGGAGEGVFFFLLWLDRWLFGPGWRCLLSQGECLQSKDKALPSGSPAPPLLPACPTPCPSSSWPPGLPWQTRDFSPPNPVVQRLFFFFFMWTVFKSLYWICYNIASVLCLVFWPQDMCDLSYPTRDRTCTPCIGRWSLSHWTSREVSYSEVLGTSMALRCPPVTSCSVLSKDVLSFVEGWDRLFCLFTARCWAQNGFPGSPHAKAAMAGPGWETAGLGEAVSGGSWRLLRDQSVCGSEWT